MADWWKIGREVRRLGLQLRAIPEAVYEPFVARAHDRRMARGLPVIEGAVAPGAKVALLLAFQPGGLVPSFLHCCRHLAARGYAPLVVSNAPLSAADRAALEPLVWRAVERPNFGYDFGGYRDGLRLLARWGVTPERVLILNDSVWFPLFPDETLIARLEASDADLSGTILRDRDGTRFLEGYCLMVPGRTLTAAPFVAFWDGLRLSSNKHKVVRRGERGLSVALARAGLQVAPVFTRAEFEARLAARPDSFLRRMLEFSDHADTAPAARLRQVLAMPDGPEWRAQAMAHVAQVLERGHFNSAFPYGAVHLVNYPLLKKGAQPVNRLWRESYARAVAAGVLPPPASEIAAELAARLGPLWPREVPGGDSPGAVGAGGARGADGPASNGGTVP